LLFAPSLFVFGAQRACGFWFSRVWAAPSKHKKISRERERGRLIFEQKVILLLCLLTAKQPIPSRLIQEKNRRWGVG
jgi:hypothetical protein